MKSEELRRRREQLMAMMGEGALAIVPTSPERVRNRDVTYPYRPDSDFYYLTGFPEPRAVAVLAPGRGHGQYLLFCQDRDPQAEAWTGYRAGPEGACRDYGADDAFPIDDIDEILPGLLEQCERVYYTMGSYPEFDQRLIRWLTELRERGRAGVHAPAELVSLTHVLHEMRLIKSRVELSVMKRAARITAKAHARAMGVARPGMYEYELAAEYTYDFARNGCEHAYPPIVGGGANACVLHYTRNADALEAGSLVLVDAGAELECYAADVTRTFPVSGRFSPEQREIYQLVLEAQLAAIDHVRAGNYWNRPHEAAVQVLSEGLVDLGLLVGPVAEVIERETYRRFFIHRTGHWLGMDVHDVGEYKLAGQWRELEPGMVTTVEPGLYISPECGEVEPRWRGIGVRIEDDVVVTREAPEVLTREAPKTLAEVEAAASA